jgi:ABC-type glycerol-3-phosphate transport system substrate-binding protein
MRTPWRLVLRAAFIVVMVAFAAAWVKPVSAGQTPGLDYFKQAKINWRQYEGQKLSLGLNKTPYTESLVPLLPQFESLTGIKIEYLILPEQEFNAKVAADLANQSDEFNVIRLQQT